ncbi:MAG: hypothetical protein MJ108_10165 [Saccharofermentans sp.]|nr:hypothetical protein [Saccharofermentans sp.]
MGILSGTGNLYMIIAGRSLLLAFAVIFMIFSCLVAKQIKIAVRNKKY